MRLLQYTFIVILNLLFRITGRLQENTRNILVSFFWFLMIAFFYACYSMRIFHIDLDYTQKGIINIGIMLVIIIMSVNGPLKLIKWNRIVYIPWFICGGIILVSGIFYDLGPGFITFAISICVLFPCLFFVWNNRKDYDKLFSAICKAVVLNTVILFLVCIFLSPLSLETLAGGRYTGPTGNPNNLGMISAAAVTCCLYLIFKRQKFAVFYMIVCEISVSLELFSGARTSFLSIALQFILFTLFFIKYYMNYGDKIKAIIKIVALFVLVIGCIPLNKALITEDNNQNGLFGIDRGIIYAEEAGNHATEPIKSEIDSVENRMNIRDGSLDQFSSGRISIWKAYIKHIRFTGHTVTDQFVVDEETGGKNSWAHNVFLELSYRSGLVTGVLYAFVVLYTVLFSIRCFFLKQYYKEYYLFSVLATASFCIISMLEMATFPLERDFILLYFVGLAPIFCKLKVQEE